jgi:hypothetical protein
LNASRSADGRGPEDRSKRNRYRGVLFVFRGWPPTTRSSSSAKAQDHGAEGRRLDRRRLGLSHGHERLELQEALLADALTFISSSIFFLRIVSAMFMQVCARCAHQPRPPPGRRSGRARRSLPDNLSALRTSARRACCHNGRHWARPTGVHGLASRAGSNRGLAIVCTGASVGRRRE